MPLRSVSLCKPCLNKKYSLRTQLLLSFLILTVVSLLLALADVVGTTLVVGNKAEERAKQSLEEQIKRHLKAGSTEAAATIGEKLRRLKDGVLDATAYALRDTLREDLILAGGSQGYPLSPTHTDLRDTEIANSSAATLDEFPRQNIAVDPSRSVWYYSNETSFTTAVSAEDMSTIEQTARLDLLWPTMYANSNNTKAVFVGLPLSSSVRPAFRYFPGAHLSGAGDLYSCKGGDANNECFNASDRPWYSTSVDDDTGFSTETKLGDVIVTDPYIGASGGDWLVTMARAVYGDADSASNNLPLGVVGVDVLLEAVQELVEEITFLQNGYSILATAKEGHILAAPARVWDRSGTEDKTTVCAAANGMCSDHAWEDLLSSEVVEFRSTSFSDDGVEKEAILIAAPVTFTVDAETGRAVVTHYIISAVTREEIFSEADRMSTLIRESAKKIWVITVSVAAATVIAVFAAVCAISGSITGSISKMAAAARSIAGDGAKTDVFASVKGTWGGGRNGVATGGGGGTTAGGGFNSRKKQAVDYLLCRGEDEISALAHEFSLMITGLGKRGSAARATGMEDSFKYMKNPFATELAMASSRTAASAPSAPYAK